MSWYGKIIGGSIGALFGPGGMVAGATFGHHIDNRGNKVQGPQGTPQQPAPAAMSREQRQHVLFHHTFAMFAKVAKADGFVTQEEVTTIKKFMVEPLTLSRDSQKKAIGIFNAAKNDQSVYATYSEEFALAFRHDLQTRATMFEMLLAIALSDGLLHPGQDLLLRKTLNDFSLNPETYEKIRRELLPDLDSLYKTMGCAADCSDAALKKAFRKASKDYHPDTLSGSNVSDGVRELAMEKFKEINTAYSTLCKIRNLK
jgi:DnaJ like chaperone protein